MNEKNLMYGIVSVLLITCVILTGFIVISNSNKEPLIIEVEKVVQVDKIVEVEKIVQVDKIVEVEKIVEVDRIVEVEKIIEVEKIVYVDRIVEVAPPKQAVFNIYNKQATRTNTGLISANYRTTATATVTNVGNIAGTVTVEFKLQSATSGTVFSQSKTLTLQPYESQTITFVDNNNVRNYRYTIHQQGHAETWSEYTNF